MRRDNDEMHRFVQMAVCAMLAGANGNATRQILVNRAVELWEEINKQVPEDKKDD